jgi:hypothetical protein
MEEFPTRPIEMCGDSTLEWFEDNSLRTTPAHSNTETLPAKKESIDRMRAGSQDCDGGSHRCQEDAASLVAATRESDPDINTKASPFKISAPDRGR